MIKIAFVCTGNSFKSIVGERFGNEFNDGRFEVFSAGTAPRDVINQEGKEIMESLGYSMENYKPSSFDTLPKDLNILVKMGCDVVCPIYKADKTFDFGLQDMTDKKETILAIKKKVQELLKSL